MRACLSEISEALCGFYEKGVQVHGSVIQEFWEAHESRGEDFGDECFV